MKSAVLGLILVALSSSSALAESNGNGGDEFRKAAIEYQFKAEKASSQGMSENARIYQRLSAIKRHAAKLADQGRWSEIDWTEYHQLTAQLSGHGGKSHKGY